MHRRLPVYLLLDCSESMVGVGIKAVREGLKEMLTVLRQDPHALETAWISILTFGATARVDTPLTELTEVQEPNLTLGQGTSLGAALDLLDQQIRNEVNRGNKESKGDFRPLALLLTDGQPTDDWQPAKERFDEESGKLLSNFHVVGCGKAIDFKYLSQMSESVFSLSELTPESMRKLFSWMTQTVISASIVSTDFPESAGKEMAPLPREMVLVKPNGDGMRPPISQLLLPSMCAKVSEDEWKTYLMRYERDGDDEPYLAAQAHKLETSDIECPECKPLRERVSLEGDAPCPYCQAEGWIQCGNCCVYYCTGALELCASVEEMTSTCPNCKEILQLTVGNQFMADS